MQLETVLWEIVNNTEVTRDLICGNSEFFKSDRELLIKMCYYFIQNIMLYDDTVIAELESDLEGILDVYLGDAGIPENLFGENFKNFFSDLLMLYISILRVIENNPELPIIVNSTFGILPIHGLDN